ncbi:MAG TPA: hypothetical protein DIT97_20100, partial [Gimesia maris]|nr:hypothetical protein [Gimesia maris]
MGDSLQILGGDATTVEHEFTNANDGFVFYDGEGTATITYTGLEPILDSIVAANRIFSYTGGDETITLDDDTGAVADYSQIGSTLGELVTFLNPTDSLEIDASASGGSDTDVIDIEGIDVNFDADLSVIGSVGDDDSVNFEATNIGAGNLFVDVDGTVTIYDQFTTTGTVGINAGLIDFFAGPFTLSAGAGLSQLNSDTDILLGEIASAGDVALDATGDIIDDNGVTNNISATNVILTAGTDIGAGDALDLDVGALEASAGAAINVVNSSGATLTVGGLSGS